MQITIEMTPEEVEDFRVVWPDIDILSELHKTFEYVVQEMYWKKNVIAMFAISGAMRWDESYESWINTHHQSAAGELNHE